MAVYLQHIGVNVIPSINWGDTNSFDWCFDGEPVGGCVAVSSVGTQMEQGSKDRFLNGYNEMLERLNPSMILFWGSVPDECKGNIVKVEEFHRRLRRISKNEGDTG